MKLLLPWISALAILTSFVIIEGTWIVRCFVEWPRATIHLIERPHVANPIVATPTTISAPTPTPRKSGATISVVGTSESQSLKPRLRLSDSGSIPDTSTIRGGALVSTGDERTAETAEARGLVNQPETHKRQLHVAEGGLTAPEDAGSPRHQNQSFTSHNLSEMIVSAAGLCGVSPALMFRLVARESGMRQWDKAGKTLRSTSGALGLSQVKPRTARGISKTLDPHLPWDNLLLGACYYRQMLDRFGGDQHRALVAYHNGPSGGMAAKGVQYADSIMEAQ